MKIEGSLCCSNGVGDGGVQDFMWQEQYTKQNHNPRLQKGQLWPFQAIARGNSMGQGT